jgi:hypothetical protein
MVNGAPLARRLALSPDVAATRRARVPAVPAGFVTPDMRNSSDPRVWGAVLRVRPKAMTVAVIVAGLLPIMLGGDTGSEVMRRIAAPMVGGMITAPLLSMLVLPAAYLLLHRRELRRSSAVGKT